MAISKSNIIKFIFIPSLACALAVGIFFAFVSDVALTKTESSAANQDATFVPPNFALAPPPTKQQAWYIPGSTPAQQLAALKKCYSENTCGFEEKDSHSAHFETVGKIIDLLGNLPVDLSPREKHQLVREFIAFPDPQVQAAALRLAASLPAESMTVAAVIAALRDTTSEDNFLLALPILNDWKKLGLDSGLDNMLMDTLRVGGIFAAQTVAENILPLLTRDNLSSYKNLLAEMPDSRRKIALRNALSEFESSRKSHG